MQKMGEAEALAWGGVHNILVSNPVVGASKLARFAALSTLEATCTKSIDGLGASAGRGRSSAGRGLWMRWWLNGWW